MRLILDVSSSMPPRTGIGNYTFQLARELLRSDPANAYTLFFNSLRRPLPDRLCENLRPTDRIRRRRIPGAWLHQSWRFLHWPDMETLAGPADLVHAPAAVLPPVRKVSLVATLHDCFFMRRPEHCHRLGGLYLRATIPGRIERCAAVICVSRFTREETLECFPLLDPARVHIAHSGVDCDFFRPMADGDLLKAERERLRLPPRFLLTVATLEPRKNLEGLLQSLVHLKRILPDFPRLVCAGPQGFQTKPIRRRVADLRLAADVFFTGFVSDETLRALYNLAGAVLAPSFYEGFGLPVLEAMACGAPVIASEAFREAAGDAAVYAPAADSAAFAEKIKELLLSPSLQAECRRKGLERARQFPWRETARKTLAVYEAVHAAVRKR